MTDPNTPASPDGPEQPPVPPTPPVPPAPPTPPAEEPQAAPAAPPPPAGAPPAYGTPAPGYGTPPPGGPGGPAYASAGYGAPAYGAPPAAKSPVLSIISLIAGIVGFVLAFIFGSGILFSIAAVILGFLGRSKEPQARGMWLTGIILGFVGILIAIVAWIFVVVSLSMLGNYNYGY